MGMDFPPPHPVQCKGSRLARAALGLLGWRIAFEGLPGKQGVIVVYPHTSNWDFVIGILLKWAVGMSVQFWSKEALFRVPLFGAWLRWVGGVPINRSVPQGAVGHMAALMQQKKARDEYFWLALTPEGTRRHTAGWRSGFYRLALQADVPVGLAGLDYSRKRLVFLDFVRLTGDEGHDLARMAQSLQDCRGLHQERAAPVRLISSGRPQAGTIVK